MNGYMTILREKKRAWLGHPHLIKNVEKKFGKHMQDDWSHKIPHTSKLLIIRPMVISKKISMEDQQGYELGVSMLLYMVKHLHPNLANVTRELSKANDDANPAAYKELLCVIRFVLDTKNLVLKIEPMQNSNKLWEIVCFGDNDYAGDPVSKKSMSGFILYVLSVPFSWQSKLQKSVSLSSLEAEYTDLPEAVKEVMFIIQLLGSMKILVKYPVTVRVDK